MCPKFLEFAEFHDNQDYSIIYTDFFQKFWTKMMMRKSIVKSVIKLKFIDTEADTTGTDLVAGSAFIKCFFLY